MKAVIHPKPGRRPRRHSLQTEPLLIVRDGKWNIFAEMVRRCSSSRLSGMQLSPSEYAVLHVHLKAGLAPRGAKYICWRKTTLGVSFIPMAIATFLKLSSLWHTSNWTTFTSNLTAYLPFVGNQHVHFFESIFYMWIAQNIIYSITLLGTLGLILYGLVYWHEYSFSRDSVRRGYLLSFIVPFIVLLFVPFRQSVDFNGLKSQICMEKLNTLLALPPLTDLNISTVEVCDRPSNEWIPIIQNSIREAGLEIDADKDGVTTCENALRKFNATQSISLNNTASSRPLPKICSLEYCKRCFDGPECVNMAAGILYGGIKHECSVCYEKKQGGRSCMETCTAFYDPQRMLQTDVYCLKDITSMQLEALAGFVAQIDYAQYFVGSFIGAFSLQTLFPAGFSLMFGSIRGARVTKSIAPWSRLPGYGMGAAVILGMPMLAALLITIHQVIGDIWSSIGLAFLFGSIAIWFPTGDWSHGILPQDDVGLLEPQNYQVAINEISGRNKISMVMKITSIIFAVLFMSHSQIGKLVKTEVQTYVLQNEASVLSRLSETVFSFFLELIGKSLLSAVVFSDICIDIFASMTTGDLEDTSMVQSNRKELAWTLDTLVHPKLGTLPDPWAAPVDDDIIQITITE